LTARQAALLVAHDFENLHGLGGPGPMHLVPRNQQHDSQQAQQQYLTVGSERDRFTGPGVSQEDYHDHEQQRPQQGYYDQQAYYGNPYQQQHGNPDPKEFQRDIDEEGAFVDPNVPIDEAIAAHAASLSRPASQVHLGHKMDPPDDEPPSLSKRPAPVPSAGAGHQFQSKGSQYSISSGEPSNTNYFAEGEYYSSPSKTQDERYYESTENGKYYATSPDEDDVLDQNFSPDVEDDDDDDEEDEFLSPDMSEDILSPGNSEDVDEQMQHEFNDHRQYPTTFDRPPVSPRSPHDGSEYSQSSAMRGAQDMLKRNRQRRLETARRLREEHEQHQQHDGNNDGNNDGDGDAGNEEDDEFADKDLVVTESESGVTWDSGSEVTSVVSGSSVWTDNSNNPDRSSRRALILQMAKARMKGNKVPGDMGEDAIPEESYDEENDEEKKNDVLPDNSSDIDMGGDLD
jgi:hypothetical protein